MRKVMGIMLAAVLIVFFAVGFITSVEAKKPVPCTYKCINGLGYLCCIVDGEEVCTYDPKIDCIRP